MSKKLKKSEQPAIKRSFDVLNSFSGGNLIPPLKLLSLPFVYVIDNFMPLLKLTVLFALLIGSVSLATGFAYICGIPLLVNFYCSNSIILFVVHVLLKYFLLFFFAVKWYEMISQKKALNLPFLLSFDNKTLKAIGALALMWGLNLIPFVSFYLLAIREPNPDATIELIYFGVVSIGFLVPFVVLRFYSVFGLILDDTSFTSLKEIWNRGKGNSLRIIIALFLIFMLALFAFLNFYLNMQSYDYSHPLWVGISSEFVYELILLVLLALFVGHCYTQKYFLYGDKDEGNN